MDLNTVSFRGDKKKPSVVFIHGLGMDKDIWANPSRSRILGGMLPLARILRSSSGKSSRNLATLFDDFRKRECPVISWSQRRPAGPINSVVPELREIIRIACRMSDAGFILIGHSRGGLIGRKYLLKGDSLCQGLITIATPHKGSAVARLARYVSSLTFLITPFVSANNRSHFSQALGRIRELLKSRALQELLPESSFFKTLCDGPLEGVSYISAGGTNPALFTYSSLSFPGILENVIPENLYPDEMKNGKGDGLVSADSSKIPWGNEHFDFDCNHAEILFDETARGAILNAAEKI